MALIQSPHFNQPINTISPPVSIMDQLITYQLIKFKNRDLTCNDRRLGDHRNQSNLTNNQVYIAEVSTKAQIDTASDIATALTDTNGVLDAIDIDC